MKIRYIPKKHLQYEYPDEYMASDEKPCNNIKVEDEDEKMYKAPMKPSGKSHGRKRGIQRRSSSSSARSSSLRHVPPRHSNMDISELGVDKEDRSEDVKKEDKKIKTKVEGKAKRKKDKDTDTTTPSTTVPYTKVEGNDKFGY